MSKENKRSKKIDVRFTQEEYALIEAMEAELGMSKTDLVRSRLLNNGQQLSINAKELLKQLNAIGAELGRAGNNINQLARHANVLHKKQRLPPNIIEQFNAFFSEYLEKKGQLNMLLRSIVRTIAA